jgi:hypothetical protein
VSDKEIPERPIIKAKAFQHKDRKDRTYPNLIEKDGDSVEDYRMLVDIDEVIQVIKHYRFKVNADSNMSLPSGENSCAENYADSYLRKAQRWFEKAKQEEFQLDNSSTSGDSSE